jgi:hypothetical protein
MKNIFVILLLAGLVLPSLSHAYKVTDRQITKLSDTLTMYTLEFEFGFLNADMWMPLVASKSIEGGNNTSSLVLSTAPIKDKKYFVPMKSNATFTFLVLEEHAVGKSKGTIKIDKLPVIIKKKDEDKKLWVFQGEELKDFIVE